MRWLRVLPILLAATTWLVTPPAAARGPGGGGRGAARPNISHSGPASHGSVRHPSHRGGRSGSPRQDTRRDRSDSARETRSDRREFRQDAHEERREFRRDVHQERHDWWEDRHRRRVGATLTAAAFRALTCTPTVIVVDQIAFYRCSDIWYNRRYVGGSVTYVVVTVPRGY